MKRERFVTNSSSSHVIVSDPQRRLHKGAPWEPGEFGWQYFILTKPEDKAVYMAVMLMGHLRYGQGFTDEEAIQKTNTLLGDKILYEENDYYIDHQSRIALPKRKEDPEGWVCMPFFKDLFKYTVFNPEIAIIGGNDNSDYEDHSEVLSGCERDPVWTALHSAYSDCTIERQDAHGWMLTCKPWYGKSVEQVISIKFPEPHPEPVELQKFSPKVAIHEEHKFSHKDVTGRVQRSKRRKVG